MARSKLTALDLQEQYGDVLTSAPFRDCASPFLLRGALASRDPPVEVSLGVVTMWWTKYKLPEGAVTVTSAQDLEQRFGDSIRHLALEYPTAFKLCKALRSRVPPLCISDMVARVWLQQHARHGEVQQVENAGHLETLFGERIRSDAPPDITADALQRWLLKEHAVSVRARIRQTFIKVYRRLFRVFCMVLLFVFSLFSQDFTCYYQFCLHGLCMVLWVSEFLLPGSARRS